MATLTPQEWIEYYRFHPSEFEAFIKFTENIAAERDALKEALKKQTEITRRLLGAIPYGNNPYAIHYVETVTGNHDDLLAKLEV